MVYPKNLHIGSFQFARGPLSGLSTWVSFSSRHAVSKLDKKINVRFSLMLTGYD